MCEIDYHQSGERVFGWHYVLVWFSS